MRKRAGHRDARPSIGVTFWVLGVVAGCAVACGPTPDDEILPGRSRPLLQHDWPHPRDYRFASNSFKPFDAPLVTTPSGLRAYVISETREPVVRISAALPLGRLRERPGEEGASRLLIRLMTGGDPEGAESLQTRLDKLGSRLEVEEFLDAARISLDVLPASWRQGLSLLIDVLSRVDFDEAFIRAHRAGTGYTDPTSRVEEEFFRPKVELERLLGPAPLAPPAPGETVSPAAVRALAARSLGPNRIVLGIGGDAPREEIESALVELARGWQTVQNEPEWTPLRLEQPAKRLLTIDAPELSDWVPRQGWVAIGRVLQAIPDSERGPLEMLRAILLTRLNIAVREIRGLANHTVLFTPDTATGAGLLHIRTGGRQESVAPLVHFCLDELRRAHSGEPVSQQEMEEARGFLVLGEWQALLDGAGRAASTYALETLRYGSVERLMTWPERVRSVTSEQVGEAARKYLDPDEWVTVIVGPIESIRRARHPRWPVELETLASPDANPR